MSGEGRGSIKRATGTLFFRKQGTPGNPPEEREESLCSVCQKHSLRQGWGECSLFVEDLLWGELRRRQRQCPDRLGPQLQQGFGTPQSSLAVSMSESEHLAPDCPMLPDREVPVLTGSSPARGPTWGP